MSHTACMLPVNYPDSLSLCPIHTHTHKHLLSGSCLAHHFSWIFSLIHPGTELFPVSQIHPLFFCIPQSVPPVLSLLPCVPSSRASYVRVLVVQCGMRWGGGGADQPKRGCSIVPTHSIHPPLICRSLGHLRGQSKGCRDGITDTQSTHVHTSIELTLFLLSILNECKWET